MAQTGKKINELAAITTVSNETVLPAVYVSGGNPSSTANKVSIEQISNKITNDLSTILNSKQDKLTAGDNVTIESNVISATDTKYTAGTNITISEQNVISADVDALPSQTGQGGKFLTTDGTDASWAEVNIPNNVWTQDNLKAGENVTITQIQKPVIDSNTIALYHFNNNYIDEITGNTASYNTSYPPSFIQEGKFGYGVYPGSSDPSFITLTSSIGLTNKTQTLDMWVRAVPASGFVGYIYISKTTSTSGPSYHQIMISESSVYLSSDLSGINSEQTINITPISLSSWHHIAYEVDSINSKIYLFLDGKKIYDKTITYSVTTSSPWKIFGGARGGQFDEVRYSDIVRWTSDFTPYTEPYAAASGPTEYQINAIVPQGGSAPTLTWYTGNTGTTVTIADTTSASLVKVYKNGILLEPTEDYSISGTTLTLVSALESQDKITTEVFA